MVALAIDPYGLLMYYNNEDSETHNKRLIPIP
jgi:hypothetical protein